MIDEDLLSEYFQDGRGELKKEGVELITAINELYDNKNMGLLFVVTTLVLEVIYSTYDSDQQEELQDFLMHNLTAIHKSTKSNELMH